MYDRTRPGFCRGQPDRKQPLQAGGNDSSPTAAGATRTGGVAGGAPTALGEGWLQEDHSSHTPPLER